ncbi:MAG: site-2 protease family protein [Ferruginibacter sp.]|nr:site-2 protease family protein [Cytophagales bacterium]
MPPPSSNRSSPRTLLVQLGLFVTTLITTTMAGAEWQSGKFLFFIDHPLGWPEFWQGLYFSVPFLGILTAHEFGHYLTARYYRVRVTLPYYIPLWLGFVPGFSSLGTMGALIRLRQPLDSRQQFFDIGIAGPLAGFALALGVLLYGFTHLPPKEHIFSIHPEYRAFGLDYEKHVYTYAYLRAQDSLAQAQWQQQAKALALAEGKPYRERTFQPQEAYPMEALGSNLLFKFFEEVVVQDPRLIPNPHEMMHYPFLLAGYFALFFTALNLLPIGQLDGGHILYSLIGSRWHGIVSPALLVGFVAYAGLGLFRPADFAVGDQEYVNQLGWLTLYVGVLYVTFSRITENRLTVWMITLGVATAQILVSTVFPRAEGYPGWLVFGLVLGRFLGIYHPPALHDQPLNAQRQWLGWFALVVFILCITPQLFIISTVSR